MSYTPGPWKISTTDLTFFSKEGTPIAFIDHISNIDFIDNISLIQTAPELLEVLESLICNYPYDDQKAAMELISKAKEIIKKAKGE